MVAFKVRFQQFGGERSPTLPLILAIGALFALADVAAAAPSPITLGRTTRQQTIAPASASGFSLLQPTGGEPYIVRHSDLGPALPRRHRRRQSLLYFAQISDMHMIESMSPLRLTAMTALGAPYFSTWRPQDALAPFSADATIRQINALRRSPILSGQQTRAKMGLAVVTGDSSDDPQRNLAEWALRLLEGGRFKRAPTNSRPFYQCAQPPPAHTSAVQVPLPPHYDPASLAGPYANWPAYPGLFERAAQEFDTPGLSVPSYIAVGNHDRLVQGSALASQFFDQAAIGCPPAAGSTPSSMSPNWDRHLIDNAEFRQIYTGGRQLDAHGFGYIDPNELAASNGAASYYAFDPKPGFRFIVLNTVSEAGVSGDHWASWMGNIDHPQFLWLERELRAASDADKLIVVFSHHGSDSLTARVPDELAPACTTPAGTRDPIPGCKRDPRDSRPIHLGPSVVALLQDYPHVIAWVSGHDHLNAIKPRVRDHKGFWEIRTAAGIDWPQQSRLLEIFDNHDGTLSIFSTLLDNAGEITIPPAGTPASQLNNGDLAAIARTFSYNDPIAGQAVRAGRRDDHNVELPIKDPRERPVPEFK